MAVVISLASRLRTQSPQARTQRPEAAAILFFTGVRYEREAEPVAADPVVRRRSRALAQSPAVRSGPRRRPAPGSRRDAVRASCRRTRCAGRGPVSAARHGRVHRRSRPPAAGHLQSGAGAAGRLLVGDGAGRGRLAFPLHRR
ncbi:MAG: hypothetical protein C0420_03500 [Methylobacterium sp.]|nr:hypothetical protein [Methylobacterium sp.]